jgi:hypothetical protein
MFTSLIKNDVPFATLLAPPLADVVLTSSTSAVTAVVLMLDNTKPSTTVVVLEATVYITYGVPAEAGSAAKVTTLKVFAIYFLLFTYIILLFFKKVND